MKKNQTKQIPCFKRWSRKGYSVFASLRRYVTIGVLSVSMSIVLLATNIAKADTTDSLAIFKNMKIDSVGVTGSRACPTRSVMSQTALFDRKAQTAAPVQTLEAALRLTPSVDVRERGGKGSQADIAIRGGSFDQTMVLLNGINFTDARTGHQSHSLPVDLDCVSSVELVDGVSGVGAYAGAVNVRTAPLKPTYIRMEAVGGSYGYAYANVSGAVTKERLSVLGVVSYRRTDGYTHNTDFSNYNAFLRMNYDSRKAGFFDLQVGYQWRAFGSNGFYAAYNPDQYEQTSTALASLRWVKTIGALTLNSSVSYRKNFDRYDWTRGTAMNYHNTDNVGAELWGDYRWSAGQTSLGADYTYNHIFSTNLGEVLDPPNGKYLRAKSRNVANVWLRHIKRFRHFDAAGSVGVSSTPYGSAAMWSLVGGYMPTDGLRVEVGAVQSMRLPTFTDLYYTSPAQLNNLDLVPEHAVTYHLKGEFARRGWNTSVRAFYRVGHDIIDWVWREELGKWHSEQENSLNTYGVELSAGYRADGFLRSITASYGYLDTSKRADIVTSSAMDYMKHKAALSVELHFLRNFSFVLTGSLYDRNGNYTYYLRNTDGSLRLDADGNMMTEMRDFKPYFLLDGRLSWQKGVCKLYVDATNITDTDYFDFGGLRLPGCWVTGGVVITLGK